MTPYGTCYSFLNQVMSTGKITSPTLSYHHSYISNLCGDRRVVCECCESISVGCECMVVFVFCPFSPSFSKILVWSPDLWFELYFCMIFLLFLPQQLQGQVIKKKIKANILNWREPHQFPSPHSFRLVLRQTNKRWRREKVPGSQNLACLVRQYSGGTSVDYSWGQARQLTLYRNQ